MSVLGANGVKIERSERKNGDRMLKAIIVDDEAPARSELNFLLEETGQVEVVAEAANVREAIEKLKDIGADIMFLDVNMPGANGLALALTWQMPPSPRRTKAAR